MTYPPPSHPTEPSRPDPSRPEDEGGLPWDAWPPQDQAGVGPDERYSRSGYPPERYPAAGYPNPQPPAGFEPAPARWPLAALERPGLLLPPGHPGGVGTYEFHRLPWLNPHKHWWRPLVVLVVAAAVTAILMLVFTGVVLQGPEAHAFSMLAQNESGDIPMTFRLLAIELSSVILMLPGLLVGYAVARQRYWGFLLSVTGHVRWRWLAVCLAFALVSTVVPGLVGALGDGSIAPETWHPMEMSASWPAWALLCFLVLLPLQCLTEELIFRGYLMQAVGTWLAHPVFAIVLQVPFFVVGHLYHGWAMAEIATFALVNGYLAWRTGGLEAPFALHFTNNLLAFFVTVFIEGAEDPTTSGTAGTFVVALAGQLLFVALVEWRVRRGAVTREAVIAPRPGVRYQTVAAFDYRNQPIDVQLPVEPVLPDMPGVVAE